MRRFLSRSLQYWRLPHSLPAPPNAPVAPACPTSITALTRPRLRRRPRRRPPRRPAHRVALVDLASPTSGRVPVLRNLRGKAPGGLPATTKAPPLPKGRLQRLSGDVGPVCRTGTSALVKDKLVQTSIPPKHRHGHIAPPTRSSGQIPNRMSTTSGELTITATRKPVLICVRKTRSPKGCARRKMRSARKLILLPGLSPSTGG
jgi:hypothetical protein